MDEGNREITVTSSQLQSTHHLQLHYGNTNWDNLPLCTPPAWIGRIPDPPASDPQRSLALPTYCSCIWHATV